MVTTADYDEDEIDANMSYLLSVLNSLPGIRTVLSCGGHENPEDWQMPVGKWYVEFEVKERLGYMTMGGYGSLGRIAGMCAYMVGVTVVVRGSPFVEYDSKANADMVKLVGIHYRLNGEGVDPDDVAEALLSGVIPKSLRRSDVRVTPLFPRHQRP